MRIKQLTLQGFKTFAKRTELTIDGDITAVIGPNGSGKSNVADAIRWVLGEQSISALRARKTEDLIFSGSAQRAQQGMAEVTMVFDNTDRTLPLDYTEVSITRRAFRSGESEYFINKSRVRLKDIQELISSIGQSFMVVGQGLSDEILSLKPDERRALFEEAAGIRPFYTQRDEALRRLSRTEENMLRVSDLLAELEPQLKHLERQARHARDYKVVEGELHEALDLWYGRQWREAQLEHRAARGAAEAAGIALEANRMRANVAERRMHDLRGQTMALRDALDTLAHEHAGVLRSLEGAERDAAIHAERLASLERQGAQADDEVREAQPTIEAAGAQLAALEAEQGRYSGEEQEMRAALAGAESAFHAAIESRRSLDKALTQARERNTEMAARAAGLRQRLASSQDHERELNGQAAEQEDALRSLESRLQVEQQELEKARAALAEADASGRATQESMAAADEDLRRARQGRDEAERGRRKATTDLDAVRTRLELVNSLVESGAGLPHAVRMVLQSVGGEDPSPRRRKAPATEETGLNGIVGVVANLIAVPEELETAVEVALGGRLYDVVVESFPDAEAAISLLKRRQAGRATFLPLDSLRVQETGANTLRFLDNAAGVRGRAADLIETSSEYLPVVEHLLGRTVIVDDLKVARRVLNKVPNGWNIVTINGEIVRSSGAVSGGSAVKEAGLLAREREKRELVGKVAEAERLLAQATKALDELAGNLIRAEQAATLAAEDFAGARRVSGERRGGVAQQDQRVQHSRQELQWRSGLRDGAVKARSDFAQKLTGFAADLAKLAEQANPQAERVASLERDAQDARAHEAAIRDELQAERTRLAVAEEGAKHRRGAVVSARIVYTRLLEQQEARRKRLEASHEEANNLAGVLAQSRLAADEWQGRAAELAGRLGPAQEAWEARQDELQMAERQQTAAQSASLGAESVYGHAAVELERRQSQLDQLRVRVEEDLGLGRGADELVSLAGSALDLVQDEMALREAPTPAWLSWQTKWSGDAPAGDESDEDVAALEGKISGLRGRIRRIGPVNPLAIEEHESAQTRHQFLSSQIADLTAASAGLKQVAADLDRIMRERLSETFKTVSIAFSETFPRLFGGGSARLELTDPQNMAASGIEILAQPPGKRLQPSAALSGGERALTSVALLFAILKVNPAPFCVMDEVDAALDEANIGRFRNELRDLAARTQFILITHNRATIEAAGAIYGVSLGQDYVSQVLSLRLEQLAA